MFPVMSTSDNDHQSCFYGVMKVSQVVNFHLLYNWANSKKSIPKTCEFVPARFAARFGKRDLANVSEKEAPAFLLSLTETPKH